MEQKNMIKIVVVLILIIVIARPRHTCPQVCPFASIH